MDETLSLTYAELADRLGIEREAARQLVKRRRWPKWKGNDGQVRISIPQEAVSDRSSTGLRPDDETGPSPDTDRAGVSDADRTETGVLSVLTRHIERLEAQLYQALERAGEGDTLRIERDAARSERDVLTVQVEALRESTTAQVEALRAALAAAERDRDRWHEAASRIPEPAPEPVRRSWWRRLAG